MRSSLEIAWNASLRPVADISAKMGLLPDEVELLGRYKAKISLDVLDRLADRPDGEEIILALANDLQDLRADVDIDAEGRIVGLF